MEPKMYAQNSKKYLYYNLKHIKLILGTCNKIKNKMYT